MLVPMHMDYKYVYERCIEMKIDKSDIILLNNNHWSTLIPDDHFVVRVRFESAINIWKSKELPTEKVIGWLDRVDIQPMTTPTVNLFSVEDILKSSPTGESVLQQYETFGNLGEQKRKILIHTIVDYFMTNEKTLTSDLCDKISDDIVALFPKEQKETYYLWRIKKAPLGQLWDRFKNQNRKKRISKRASTNSKTETFTSLNTTIDKPELISLEDLEKDCAWLKNHSEPWSEVISKWERTMIYRRDNILKNEDANTVGILLKWPIYNHSLGHSLIDIDYKLIGIADCDILINWAHFQSKVQLVFNRIKDPVHRTMLQKCQSDPMNDYTNYLIIQLLHVFLPPTISAKKTKKYTAKDSQEFFVMLVSDSSEISSKIAALKEECFKNNSTSQPIIIVVRDLDSHTISEFYVNFDKITYKLFTLLKAIDTCFKLYQVFNLKYPTQSEIVWEFIQKYFYQLKTKFDKNTSKISSLISDLK